MDNKKLIVAWLNSHDHVFGRLQDAVTKTAQAAGRAGDATLTGEQSSATSQALAEAQEAARHLVQTVRDVRQLPPVPDETTQTAFDAGLGRWTDAAETLAEAAGRRDVAELKRTARALDAGTDEFLRAAAALRQATGQPPDPNNPRN